MKKLILALIILSSIGLNGQDFKNKWGTFVISKVSNETLEALEKIEEAKQPKLRVKVEKTVTQEGFDKLLKKNPWLTYLEVGYGNNSIKNIEAIAKLKSIKTLKIKGLKASKEQPLDLSSLKKVKTLEKVNFHGTKVINTIGLKNNKNLKKVSFYMSAVASLEFLKSTPLVEELDLYGFKHTFENYEPVAGLKNLKVLNVYMNKQAIDVHLKVLEKLESLEEISMSNCKDFTTFDFLKNCKNMRKIRASWTDGLKDISALENLTNLEYLKISRGKYTSVEALKNMKKLKRLDISRSGVTDLSPLKELKMLESVKIARTGIKDISPLKNCVYMERLEAKDTKIDDISVVENWPKLRTLDVIGCPVKDFKPVFKLVGPRRVYVSKNILDDAFKTKFKESFPKAKLYEK